MRGRRNTSRRRLWRWRDFPGSLILTRASHPDFSSPHSSVSSRGGNPESADGPGDFSSTFVGSAIAGFGLASPFESDSLAVITLASSLERRSRARERAPESSATCSAQEQEQAPLRN